MLDDIKNKTITLVCPSRKMHGDRYENALLEKSFAFESRTHLLLANMMSQYFCQSWSSVPIALWRYFQTERQELRIRCNAGKLMDAFVRFEDPYFMLHYYLGKVDYYSENDLKTDLYSREFDSYLDSSGRELLFTLLRVKDNHEDEQEVRLVYNRKSNDENQWVKNNTSVFSADLGSYCCHPIEWIGLIEDVTIDPRVSDDEANNLKDRLLRLGIKCPVLLAKNPP